MSFISLTFVVFFFIFVIAYHAVGRLRSRAVSTQRIILLAASFVFYAFADVRFVPFLLYIIAVSYLVGLFCKNRIALALFIIADLAPLLFCKYGPHFLHAHQFFPLGLSFFTFLSVSYVADVYTKKILPERNLLTVALFVSFFPVISSGPIQRAGNLMPQLNQIHRFEYDSATDGMKLFAWGMFKKLCIADRIAAYVNYVYGNAGGQYAPALLLATVLYSFQIYCDFSGYSDMAIGVARYLGFDAGKNFDHPYLSESTGEFWRRWHISLSSWLRDYVYIPIGGSRVALPRIYVNLMITFLVSGIWHGSTWNFVIWGALHGLYQCVGRATKTLQEKLRIPVVIRIIVTFCLVTFAWIFFRAETPQDAGTVIKGITGLPQSAGQFFALRGTLGVKEAVRAVFALDDVKFVGFSGMAMSLFVILILCCVEIITNHKNGLELIRSKSAVFRWMLYILFITLFCLSFESGMSSNFIYNNF